mmetsp:Transcript_12158/g.35202  ORF Transcript_12158/g.35202 Transcript_12158/m.35202 type:complete len:263 (-) Transcript_12158:1295-2083(-)
MITGSSRQPGMWPMGDAALIRSSFSDHFSLKRTFGRVALSCGAPSWPASGAMAAGPMSPPPPPLSLLLLRWDTGGGLSLSAMRNGTGDLAWGHARSGSVAARDRTSCLGLLDTAVSSLYLLQDGRCHWPRASLRESTCPLPIFNSPTSSLLAFRRRSPLSSLLLTLASPSEGSFPRCSPFCFFTGDANDLAMVDMDGSPQGDRNVPRPPGGSLSLLLPSSSTSCTSLSSSAAPLAYSTTSRQARNGTLSLVEKDADSSAWIA